MYFTTEGLVLRETDYQDHDKLLTVLTRDRGKLTLRARGVKRKRSPLKSGCQLLAFSEFTVFVRNGFHVIEEASAKELFLPLRSDLERLSLASYFAQVTEVLSQEDDPDPELLSLCLNAVYALSATKKQTALIKAAFELRAACQAGYLPDLSGCGRCGQSTPDRFCVSEGVLQCSSCQQAGELGIRLPLLPGTLDAMRYIVSCDCTRLFAFHLPEQSLKCLCDISETYLLSQLERGFFTLDFYKSLIISEHKELRL